MRNTVSHLLPAAIALAALIALGVLVNAGAGLTVFDAQISLWVQSLRNPAFDWVAILVTLFGDAVALTLIAVTVVVSLLLRRQWWWPALGCAVAFSLTPLIVRAIKSLVGRLRPTADLYEGVETFSFPSGHMTNSMVIYGALAIFAAHSLKGSWRRAGVGGFVLLILLIGFSRVYLGAHWPSDVVGAALLASAMLFIVAWGFDQRPGVGRFARPFTYTFAAVAAVWTVYAALTVQAAFDMYAVDVTPEGTIELDPGSGPAPESSPQP